MTKISILGIGRSGIAAAHLAQKNGLEPFLSDAGSANALAERIALLEESNIAYECGGHSARVFDAKYVVLSPGIKKEIPFVQECISRGLRVMSEIEFAAQFSSQPMITITGSNGKTTTTTLLGAMLSAEFGGNRIAGNIGIPLSDVVSTEDSAPLAVELSSFQLETIEDLAPLATIWLNVSPNHLDWYNSYDDYIAAKARINLNNTEKTLVVFNEDDSVVARHAQNARGLKRSFSLESQKTDAYATEEGIFVNENGETIKIVSKDELQFSGPHHLMNMMAATIVARHVCVSLENIRAVLKSFRGIEHRMEVARKVGGVTYINDTKSTSIEALKMALLSFSKKVILIAGGKHKGASYAGLKSLIAEKTKHVFLIGAAAPIMEEEWQSAAPLENVGELKIAVSRAAHIAKEGDVVLLSPACSSFDQFTDFATRGVIFKQFVNEL